MDFSSDKKPPPITVNTKRFVFFRFIHKWPATKGEELNDESSSQLPHHSLSSDDNNNERSLMGRDPSQYGNLSLQRSQQEQPNLSLRLFPSARQAKKTQKHLFHSLIAAFKKKEEMIHSSL